MSMKITQRSSVRQPIFSEIKVTECFRHRDGIYFRIISTTAINGKEINAISLYEGYTFHFDSKDSVIPLESELVIG